MLSNCKSVYVMFIYIRVCACDRMSCAPIAPSDPFHSCAVEKKLNSELCKIFNGPRFLRSDKRMRIEVFYVVLCAFIFFHFELL